MTTPDENLSVILSRDELSFLLFLLKATFIPGLDPDPMGEPTPEQQKRNLAQAERALRARDLAKVDESGNVVVREKLLLMTGICAYPELTITLHQFPSQGQPKRVFWHVRSGVIVMHTRPEPPLHGLEFLPGRDNLHAHILTSCLVTEKTTVPLAPIQATNALIKDVRESAPKDVEKAIQTLTSQGATLESAQEISRVLAGEYTVSALHLAAKQENDGLREAMTILTGSSSVWLMKGIEDDRVSLETVDQPSLLEILQPWTGLVTWL
jgi:hypothetical protein